jgi:hypothetical protein
MALVPAMHNLPVADIIPMPMVFKAVVFVAVAVTLSIFIVIFVFGAMFIVTAPVSMTCMLGNSQAGA